MDVKRPRRRVYAVQDGDRWTFREERLLVETSVENQHYVPQFYLRPFAAANRLQGFDLADGRALRGSVRRMASATGYYDIDLDGYKVSVEEWLGRLENRAAPVVEQLRIDPVAVTKLTEEQEDDLARFIVALWLRGPGFRRFMDGTRQNIVSQMRPAIENFAKKFDVTLDKVWPKNLGFGPDASMSEQDELDVQISMLNEVQGFANQLQAMPWIVGRTNGKLLLYTSDNPVARYLTPVRPEWEGGAFPAYQYFVALSPSVLMRFDPLRNDSSPRGTRGTRVFTEWETSFARHLITHDAVRFLYGTPPFVDPACAHSCVQRVSAARLSMAVTYAGSNRR